MKTNQLKINKHSILFSLAAILFFPLISNAQLKVVSTSGNVGVGTTNPGAKLSVQGKAQVGNIINGTNGDYAALEVYNTTASNLAQGNGAVLQFINNSNNYNGPIIGASIKSVSANNQYGWESDLILRTVVNNGYSTQTIKDAITIKSYGNVGIGTTAAPSEKLEVNGNIKIPAGNSYFGSDKRLKTDIDTIQHSLDIVKQLHGVYYKWDTTVMKANGFNFNTSRQIGFIAQSVQSILPEIVIADADSLGLLSLDYSRFAPVLVEAVKELAKKDSTKAVQIKTLQASDSVNTTLQNAQQQSIDSLKQDLVAEKIKTNTQDSIITSLQNQMNQLASTINSCCEDNHDNGNHNGHHKADNNQTNVELNDAQTIVLEQNIPNPFAEQTAINYSLPDNTVKAQMLFYNAQGKLIQSTELTQKGKGTLNVFASDLSSGIYTYTLVVDGKIIETRKMVKQ